MTENRLLYLSKTDVEAVALGMAEIIQLLERAFQEKGAGRVEMPPKPGIHPGGEDNFIHAMPAYIPAMKAAGVKWVSGFPDNNRRGLPYISGLLILNDPQTGLPLSVMDCTWITGMRTAAATAVAARRLARPESSTLGVLGCGLQGRTNTEALKVIFPIQKVMAYDIDPVAATAFARDVASGFEVDVEVVNKPRDAVSGCDIIVTAGPILRQPHRTIQAGWWDEGAFASLVDFDSYWHPEAIREATKFYTDDLAQLNHYQKIGYFQDIPSLTGDLGELVTGLKPGRETERERTLTCNLGLALDDMAVAPTIYERAMRKGIGTWLAL